MIVGVDVDEVLAGFTGAFARYVAKRTQRHLSEFTPPTRWSFWEQWGIKEAEFWRLFGEFGEHGLFGMCEPYAGAQSGLAALRDAGHRVVIATARGTDHRSSRAYRHRVQADTVNWLQRHGMVFDDLCFIHDKSLLWLDVLLDDGTHNLLRVADHGVRAVCFDQPHNQDWPGQRITGWHQVDVILKGES